MDNYLLFLGVALATILLPGPAVMLTINNSIQRGFIKSLAGICGVALGIMIVAAVSASSLGIILASSVLAFTAVKFIGAMYLFYLGYKMWRTKGENKIGQPTAESTIRKCFLEGFFVSITNPKAVIFFLSIFPQFINVENVFLPQFMLLVFSFSLLVFVVHISYAVFSGLAKAKLSSAKSMAMMNKVSGGVFFGFGAGLVAAGK
ncbi:LysE family translocator [Pseudoalteromonas piscicida]|uniref:LysE family translocator n=1 Tax=Pseudoalteromonas piscicida TaxID=43662 RepID=UPI0030A86D78